MIAHAAARRSPPRRPRSTSTGPTRWIWPEGYEICFGGIASVIIFALLFWKGSPAGQEGVGAPHRTHPGRARRGRRRTKSEADAEAARDPPGEGRHRAERARLLAEADDQAAALLADGRAGWSARSPSSRPRRTPTSPPLGSRDGRRAARRDRPRCVGRSPPTGSSSDTLDDETQQRLIEDFIAEVGAATPAIRSSAHDRQRPRSTGYAAALFEVARAEGTLDEVEDELFRFARSFESSDELRSALTDELIPPARRQAIVEDLLGGQGHADDRAADRRWSSASGRARDLPAIIDRLVERAAQSKDARGRRGAHAPSRSPRTSRTASRRPSPTPPASDVNLKVVVDPSVLGGLVATVGDTVIDGTVRTRLDQLKSRL